MENKNKKIKILVTGCVGFIGFHVCNFLTNKGFHVIGIDNINTYYDVNPDGATIDKMDNYYSCLWGGSRIDIYNKNNSLFNQIDVPFTYPTCCCFGGVNMNKLLITSSSLLNNNNENGKLLLIDTKYTGVNESIANI